MARFRVRNDAKVWFKDLLEEKSFKMDFDAFYFCFMAGITAGPARKQAANLEDTAELVDHFPDRYRSRGRLLVALFLTRELEALGVIMTEKPSVHAVVARLVSPDSPNYLSDEGVKEFNKYAHGGYEVLLDWFDDRPRTLDSFLRTFKRKVDAALKTN
jgi:hypothetical protein